MLGGAKPKSAVKNILNYLMVNELQKCFNWEGRVREGIAPKNGLQETNVSKIILG